MCWEWVMALCQHRISFRISYAKFTCQCLAFLRITVSTENTIFSKPTKLRNSDFTVSRGTNSNSDFGLIWICDEKFEFLDWVDFRGKAFSVESIIPVCCMPSWLECLFGVLHSLIIWVSGFQGKAFSVESITPVSCIPSWLECLFSLFSVLHSRIIRVSFECVAFPQRLSWVCVLSVCTLPVLLSVISCLAPAAATWMHMGWLQVVGSLQL